MIPRKRGLGIPIAIDYNEIEEADEFVRDTSTYNLVVNASYQGGVLIVLREDEMIDRAVAIAGQVRKLLSSG